MPLPACAQAGVEIRTRRRTRPRNRAFATAVESISASRETIRKHLGPSRGEHNAHSRTPLSPFDSADETPVAVDFGQAARRWQRKNDRRGGTATGSANPVDAIYSHRSSLYTRLLTASAPNDGQTVLSPDLALRLQPDRSLHADPIRSSYVRPSRQFRDIDRSRSA